MTPVPVPPAGLAARVHDTIVQAAGDVRVDLVPDEVAGSLQLDGVVDDGNGPGRLLVVVSPPGSTPSTNVCLDRDFAQGGACERVEYPGGGIGFRRGLVEANDVQTIVVFVRRPDGSSVLLESGNFWIEVPPVLVAGQPRPTPEITRDGPVFTVDELEALARAIADATQGCTIRACP